MKNDDTSMRVELVAGNTYRRQNKRGRPQLLVAVSKGEKELEAGSRQVRAKVAILEDIIDITSGGSESNVSLLLESLNYRYGRSYGIYTQHISTQCALIMKEEVGLTDRQYDEMRLQMTPVLPPLYRLKQCEVAMRFDSMVTLHRGSTLVTHNDIDTLLTEYEAHWRNSSHRVDIYDIPKPIYLMTIDGGGGTIKLSISIINFEWPQSCKHYIILALFEGKESREALDLFYQPVH